LIAAKEGFCEVASFHNTFWTKLLDIFFEDVGIVPVRAEAIFEKFCFAYFKMLESIS
jgi:hypothetical protein